MTIIDAQVHIWCEEKPDKPWPAQHPYFKPPVLVPFTRAVVPIVAPAEGRLVLDPPPWLLGDDGP